MSNPSDGPCDVLPRVLGMTLHPLLYVVAALHSRTCMHRIACMRCIIVYYLRMLIAYLHAYVHL